MTSVGLAPPGYFERWYAERDWTDYRGLLARVIELARPGPILDVGAGAGFFVEAAHRWGMPCTGLEGSPEGLAAARARFPELDMREQRLEHPFSLPDAHFEVALLNQVVEHLAVNDARLALNEVRRVLRPGGILLVYSPSRFNRIEAEADPTHRHLYSPRELARLLSEIGFVDIEASDAPLPLLGRTRLRFGLMRVLFKLWPVERLSATANCVARNPGA